jgi:hypothetical protein
MAHPESSSILGLITQVSDKRSVRSDSVRLKALERLLAVTSAKPSITRLMTVPLIMGEHAVHTSYLIRDWIQAGFSDRADVRLTSKHTTISS